MRLLTPNQFRWAICDRCHGNGTMDNPAFSNGFTASEWVEWDQEDREAYMSGAYDVTCSGCSGSGKVKRINVDALSFPQKRELVKERQAARYAAESAAERRAEMRHCGYDC